MTVPAALVADRARSVLVAGRLRVLAADLNARVVGLDPDGPAVDLNARVAAHVPAAVPGGPVVAQNVREVDLVGAHVRVVAQDAPEVAQGNLVADPDAPEVDLDQDVHVVDLDALKVDQEDDPVADRGVRVAALDPDAHVVDQDDRVVDLDVHVADLDQDVHAVGQTPGVHVVVQAVVPVVDLGDHAAGQSALEVDQDALVVDQDALVVDPDQGVHAVDRAPGVHDHAVDLSVHAVYPGVHAVTLSAHVVAQHDLDLRALPPAEVKLNQKKW